MKSLERMKLLTINPTHIPDSYYYSKSQAAEILNIPVNTLQWHIGQNHLPTILFPGLGHLINEWDVLEFKDKLDKQKTDGPSIY